MPNWVTNNIIVDEKDFKKLKKLLLDKDEQVDFNKLVPMPQDLQITSGSYSWEVDRFDFGFEHTKKKIKFQDEVLAPYLSRFYNKRIKRIDFIEVVLNNLKNSQSDTKQTIETSLKEFYGIDLTSNDRSPVETLFSGYFNIQRYGEKDWYDWSYANWGTKWNGSETYIMGNIISFQTAWGCPYGVIDELSKHIDFKVVYADEDLGSNFGVIEFKDGVGTRIEEIDELPDGVSNIVANLIWGYDIFNNYSEDELTEWYGENLDETVAQAQEIREKYFAELI